VKRIGPYEVLEKLGEGGMGTVYRARDPHTDRHVAVKEIKGADDQHLKRFLREAETLARVRHPGVVKIHQLEPGPPPYLVLELVEGELIDELRLPTPRHAAELMRDLCDAVAAVHREDIVHRDIKPGNVIVRDGKPVLLDFGIARDQNAETLTRTGMWVGTPAYIPPEALQEKVPKPTPATDIYALGVLLYELLMRRPPYEGSQFDLVRQILDAEPVWPRAIRRDVEPELEQILQRAMAKSPGARYPSAGALRADLDAYLAGRTPQAASPPRQRRRRLFIGAGAGSCAVAVAVALAASRGDAPPPDVEPPPAVSVAPPADESTSGRHLGSLWALDVGDRFDADLTFDERGGVVQYRLDAHLRAEVVARTGRLATLRVELEEPAAQFRFPTPGEEDLPASRESLISQVLARSMSPLGCTLNLRTGAITSLSGLQAIRQQLEAARPELRVLERGLAIPGESSVQIVNSLLAVFSQDYLGTALTSLLGVEDPLGPLTWKPGHRTGAQQRFFARDAAREPVLPFRIIAIGDAHSNPKQADVEGEAVYDAGRLVSATIRQAHAQANHSLTWSWTTAALEDDPSDPR
jgi:hypothetical protein